MKNLILFNVLLLFLSFLSCSQSDTLDYSMELDLQQKKIYANAQNTEITIKKGYSLCNWRNDYGRMFNCNGSIKIQAREKMSDGSFVNRSLSYPFFLYSTIESTSVSVDKKYELTHMSINGRMQYFGDYSNYSYEGNLLSLSYPWVPLTVDNDDIEFRIMELYINDRDKSNIEIEFDQDIIVGN